MKKIFSISMVIAFFATQSISFVQAQSLKTSLREYDEKRITAAIDRGLRFILLQQGVDGMFRDHPGMTGLALCALMKHPKGVLDGDPLTVEDYPAIKKAFDALLKMQQPDGGIYDANNQPALPNYNTSIAVMALSAANRPDLYADAIAKAQAFLKGLQITDEMSYYFGGIGYGSRQTVNDLSNTTFALQALAESEEEDPEVWKNVIKFLERCQNRSETNDQRWAADDGGFIYAPSGESKAGSDKDNKPRSYASMTYAGLLSFIYADVTKDDPRVQAAADWLFRHYTLDENYGMGKEGLFYNYHTMAKALNHYGENIIVDARGETHDWYKELADKLITLQIFEPNDGDKKIIGYWRNEEGRWMERDTLLVTAYAVLALEEGYPGNPRLKR